MSDFADRTVGRERRKAKGGYWYYELATDVIYGNEEVMRGKCTWVNTPFKIAHVLIIEIWSELSPFYGSSFSRTEDNAIELKRTKDTNKCIYIEYGEIRVKFKYDGDNIYNEIYQNNQYYKMYNYKNKTKPLQSPKWLDLIQAIDNV